MITESRDARREPQDRDRPAGWQSSFSQLTEVALSPLWRIPLSGPAAGLDAGKRLKATTGTFRFIPLQ